MEEMMNSCNDQTLGPMSDNCPQSATEHHVPLSANEELINWLTHALAAVAGIFGAALMAREAMTHSFMTAVCCLSFVISSIAVFTASALSHYWIHQPVVLNRLRAWDQGLIYVMISGTYTPLVWAYSAPPLTWFLMAFIWVAAFVGFYSKVFAQHRVNSIGVISYVLLGAIPAIVMFNRVPAGLLFWLTLGVSLYLVGVFFLLNDRRFKYMHVVWHLCVNGAALSHFYGVYAYIAYAS
jgi:hemolysin III